MIAQVQPPPIRSGARGAVQPPPLPWVRNAQAARPAAISMQQVATAANKWREQYNPLRGLTISRAVALLEAAQRGDYADLMWTYCSPWFGIETSDADLLTLAEKRTTKLEEMDWAVKAAADAEERGLKKLAEAQAEYLRSVYTQIDNLYQAIAHLEMAAFRGFSILQPQRRQGDQVTVAFRDCNHLEVLEQWNFVRDGLLGAYYWNPEARQVMAKSLPAEQRIDPATVIIREVPRHIDRIGLIKKVRSDLSDKDWDGFIEIYGIPLAIIIGPPNIPTGKEAEYESAASRVAEGGSGFLPNGSTVERAEGVRGVTPFQQRLDYLSAKLIQVGTGGRLTVLTAPGSGTLAGSAHQEAFDQIARGAAKKISEVFQRQFDLRLLAEQFPGKPVLAYFELASNQEVDVGVVLDHAGKARTAGYAIDQEQLEEMTGYKLTPAPVAAAAEEFRVQRSEVGPNRVRNREQVDTLLALAEGAMDEAAAATAEDLGPLRDRLQQILTAEDAEVAEGIKKLVEDLPALLLEINAGPELEAVLYEAFKGAMAAGWNEAAEARRPRGGQA